MTALSVIVPLHNSRRQVLDLLARLAPFVDRGAEVILVDDGSTDGTSEELASFTAERPSAKLVSIPVSEGVANARNRGLAEATGDYVWFADDDDAWSQDILDRFAEAAEHSRADIVICRADLRVSAEKPGKVIDGIDACRTVNSEEAWDLLLEGTINGYLWNKLIRRTVLGDRPFDPLSSQSDFTGVARAVAGSRVVQMIPEVLYFHVIRDGSITRRRDPNLGNLRDAHAVAARIHTEVFGRAARSVAFDYFTAWFLVLPYGRTPTRVRASWTIRIDGIRRAQHAARDLDMRALRLRSPRTHRSVWATTRFGVPSLVVLHIGHTGRRWLRKVGSS